MFAVSCSSAPKGTDNGGTVLPEGKGGIRMNVGYAGINGEDVFTGDLEVTLSSGETIVAQWEDYREMPDVVSLDPGYYSITIKTPGEMPVVSDIPYLVCETDFEVKEGFAEYVELKCTVRNMLVTVEPDDVFAAAYPEWKAELFMLNDTENMFATLTASDNAQLYVKPLPFGIKVTDNATGDSTVLLVETYGPSTHQRVVLEGIQ